MKRIWIVSLIFSCIIPFRATYSQEIYHLDLEQSIEIAREKNHDMLIMNQLLAQAGYELKAATSRLKTHIDLDLTLPDYTETIRQFEDSSGITFYPVKQLRYNGSLLISQPLPTDGRLYLSTGLDNLLDYDKQERLTRLDLRLGLTQPLSALYAYNEIRSNFKRAQLNYELSLRSLKRTELNLIYETSQAFYQLVAAVERKNIARQVLEMQQEAYDIAQSKYDAGLIMEVEALTTEVDLGEASNDYRIAEVDYESQLNYFKQTLGLSLQDQVTIASDLTYEVVEVDEEFAVTQGLANRMELRENEIQIELSKLEVKRVRSEGMINGDLSGYYDFIGTDQKGIPYPFNDAVGNSWQVMRDRPGNFGVALNIRIPIFNWGEYKSMLKAAQSGLEVNMRRYDQERINIEREIRNTVKQLNSSLNRLQLLEKNVLLAEKSFNISRQRFSDGDIDSQTLALDRTRLNAAYQSRLDSYISYKLLIADVMRKTFYDFENRQPIVQDYEF
ncbi:MAG: TolC family protein [Bacteroidales bacterium]